VLLIPKRQVPIKKKDLQSLKLRTHLITDSIFFSYSIVLYFTAICKRSLSVIFNNFHICSKRFCTSICLTLLKIVVNKRLLRKAFSCAIGSNKSIRLAFGLRFSKSCSNCTIGSSSGFNVGS
jgi:hypothetical protein